MPWFFVTKHLESFDQVKADLHLCESRDLGVMTVEVDRITGSLGRWRDFDERFRLINQSTRQRLRIIKRKMAEGHIFPPVELYKVRDKYYVADGNHRVAAAKELGVAYIDAHVTEYFPGGDDLEPLYWRERSAFERAIGSDYFKFSNPDSYRRMGKHLELFRREESERLGYEIGLPEAANTWIQDIDGPLRALVRSEKLIERFPNRTEDDLVFYVIYHHVGLLRAIKGGPQSVTYREALDRLLKAPGHTLAGRFRRRLRQLGHEARKLVEGVAEMDMGI